MENNTPTADQVVQRVRAFAHTEKLSKGRLAVRAGLRDSTLRAFDRADWNPTVKTLRALESIIPPDFTS